MCLLSKRREADNTGRVPLNSGDRNMFYEINNDFRTLKYRLGLHDLFFSDIVIENETEKFHVCMNAQFGQNSDIKALQYNDKHPLFL